MAVATGVGSGGSGGEGRSVELAVELISRMLRLRPEERLTMGKFDVPYSVASGVCVCVCGRGSLPLPYLSGTRAG